MNINQNNRIGIREVARAAGVSPTTVSHALSGKGRLPKSTRERIAKIAMDLKYRPNANAQNLVFGKTGLLGIAISESSESPFGLADFDYFIQLLTAATVAAVENGMALIVAGTSREGKLLEGVDVDGMIVVDPVIKDSLVSSCLAEGIPIVTTGRIPDGESGGSSDPVPRWVDNDHVRATTLILEHLAKRGGRKIALLTSTPVTSYTQDALLGYRTWCRNNGREPLVSIVEGSLNESAGFDVASRLLDEPQPPDAIYATLDRLAIGALSAARARGFEVPRDLIVAGCTDSKASQWADPPLTALALNPEQIGRRGVEMLISEIEGSRKGLCHEFIPATIVLRDSTAREI